MTIRGDWANPKMMKIAGLILLCVFVALDAFVRIRLKRAGHKWVFLRGGTLDYGEYRKAGTKYGWSTWPIWLLWITLIAGVALFIAGLSRS